MKRGGSWNNNANNARAANRNNDSPGNRNNNLGFRLASSGAPPARRAKGQNPGDHGLPGSAPLLTIRLPFLSLGA